jgi:hypothetical protein
MLYQGGHWGRSQHYTWQLCWYALRPVWLSVCVCCGGVREGEQTSLVAISNENLIIYDY